MIFKHDGGNPLVVVGIKDIKHMSVQHQEVLYCVVSYAFTTANVHDSNMAPVLLRDIQNQNVLFSIADAAYDSQHIYEIAETCNIFAMSPINPRSGKQIKSAHRRVLSAFVHTTFGKRLFSKLKDKGLEHPRWYGHNRYLLHVQLVFLIHDIAYLF